jgi:hypothetical protein
VCCERKTSIVREVLDIFLPDRMVLLRPVVRGPDWLTDEESHELSTKKSP